MLLASAAANAQHKKQWSVSGGVDIGTSHLDVRCDAAAAECEDNAIAKRISVAAAYGARWGVEVALERGSQYGGAQQSIAQSGQSFGGRIDVSVTSLNALYRVGEAQLPIYLRAGIARTQTEFTYTSGGVGGRTLNTWQPLLGLSLDMPLGEHLAWRWDARATRARIAEQASVLGTFTIGLIGRF